MPSPPNPVGSWEEYFSSTLEKPIHPLYRIAEPHLPSGGSALELGAGVGTGVEWLAARGFAVTAIDAEPTAIAHIQRRCPLAATHQARMQDSDLGEQKWDVVVAGFCLFFLEPAEFRAFWPRLVDSLKPGGILLAQFLGERDDWATPDPSAGREIAYTYQTAKEVSDLLEPFEVLYREEAERDGATSQGTPKHWHVTHIVARKRDA